MIQHENLILIFEVRNEQRRFKILFCFSKSSSLSSETPSSVKETLQTLVRHDSDHLVIFQWQKGTEQIDEKIIVPFVILCTLQEIITRRKVQHTLSLCSCMCICATLDRNQTPIVIYQEREEKKSRSQRADTWHDILLIINFHVLFCNVIFLVWRKHFTVIWLFSSCLEPFLLLFSRAYSDYNDVAKSKSQPSSTGNPRWMRRKKIINFI